MFLHLGHVFGNLQNCDTAARFLEQALPNLSDAELLLCLLWKGVAHAEMGDTKAAVAASDNAIANAPDSFEAHFALA